MTSPHRENHRRFHAPVLAEENHKQPQIFAYFKERVKGQDTSLNRLACTLASFLSTRETITFSMLIGGANGSGKRTTISNVRHFLGMDPGQRYAKQYVDVEGVSLDEGSQYNNNNNNIGGCEALVKRLNKAKKTATSSDTGRPESVPYLCLFIDNIERVSRSFIESIIKPLKEKAQCYAPSGTLFTLPAKTPLLILYTSHCASDEIANMKHADDLMASDLIYRALLKRWPDTNAGNHVGVILPYYPLGHETLRPMLMKTFEDFVAKSHMTRRFGEGSVQYGDEVKNLLIDHVLARVNATHGAQGSLGQLSHRLDILFSMALAEMEKLVEENVVCASFLAKPIFVSAQSIDTKRFAESFTKKLEHVIQEFNTTSSSNNNREIETFRVIESILDNPENSQFIEQCDTSKEGHVNAVTMAYGDRPLCSLVVNINYTNIHVINHRDEHDKVRHLKKKVRACRDTLKMMIDTIDKSSKKEGSSFNKKMKKIADAQRVRSLIESSSGSTSLDDDDEDDDADENNPFARSKTKRIRALCSNSGNGSAVVVANAKRVRLDDARMAMEFSDEVDFYTKTLNDDSENSFTLPKKKRKLFVEEDAVLLLNNNLDEDEEEEEEEDDEDEEGYQHMLSTYEEEVEQENIDIEEGIQWCPGICCSYKPLSSFVRKRIDRKGIPRSWVSEYCHTCRTCRKK